MAIQDSSGLIAFIGMLVQSAVTFLTVLLFWVLGRYAARRAYFTAWTAAWSVLLLGILALVARYNIVPNFDRAVLENGLAVRSFYFIYQFSKLVFVALMVLGTVMFIRPVRPLRWLMIAMPALGLFAALTVAASTSLNRIVAWQAAVIAPAFGVCAYLLYALSPERRTLGTRLVAGVFSALAVVWLLYFIGFAQVKFGGQTTVANPFSVFVINNSFIDALLGMLLTMGMVVLLMEGATREVEEARAGRLRDVASSEVRLSSVIRSATDAIVTLDSARHIHLFNPAAEEMFGTTASDATASPFDRFVIPAHREQLTALLREDAPRGTPLPLAVRHPYTGLRGSGEQFPMELSVSDFFLSGNRSQVLIVRDLTERQRAETERDELQAKLAHAHRMETVGQLVSGVAHELNNPLTAVLSFSEILLHEQRGEHDRLALSTIREQARRCRSVVRNLLTFIREGAIRRQPVLLQEVLDRVARAFEPEFAQFGITFTVAVEDSLPLLEVDPEGLEQVLTNLVSNAVHAIGTFGEITLKACDAGNIVMITVEDTGPGIPADLLPRIFEPFFGGRSAPGTGLGLCVAQSMVERHGGKLAVENREPPQRGSRFTFTLPIHPRRTAGETAASRRREDGFGAVSSLARSGSGKRVLLIEDEKSIRAALRRFFERSGWKVEEADAGKIGLSKLLERAGEVPYDLVISDLKMPDMGGIELHDRLGAVRPDLLRRFIFVTGDIVSPEAAAFIAKTTRPVLEKPFELSALSAMVIRVVGT